MATIRGVGTKGEGDRGLRPGSGWGPPQGAGLRGACRAGRKVQALRAASRQATPAASTRPSAAAAPAPGLGAPPSRARAQPAPHVPGTSPRTLCPGTHGCCWHRGHALRRLPPACRLPDRRARAVLCRPETRSRLAAGAGSGAQPRAGLGLSFLRRQPRSLCGPDYTPSSTGHSAVLSRPPELRPGAAHSVP